MAKSSGKTLIITDDDDDEEEEDGTMNPFSFREFLRSKNNDPEVDSDQNVCVGSSSDSSTFDPDTNTNSSFFSEPSMEPREEEELWGRGFHSGVDDIETEEERTRFSSRPEDGGSEADDETSTSEHSALLQLSEENLSLRRTIEEMERRSKVNEIRVKKLSEELLQRRKQEEKEAEDLESMVHSVETNLRLMTKRAVKAEASVSKLKLELQQLQAENASLKAADSAVVMTMRENAKMAAERLDKTTGQAHNCMRQLMGEAESLHLVSELLRSIDRISHTHS